MTYNQIAIRKYYQDVGTVLCNHFDSNTVEVLDLSPGVLLLVVVVEVVVIVVITDSEIRRNT